MDLLAAQVLRGCVAVTASEEHHPETLRPSQMRPWNPTATASANLGTNLYDGEIQMSYIYPCSSTRSIYIAIPRIELQHLISRRREFSLFQAWIPLPERHVLQLEAHNLIFINFSAVSRLLPSTDLNSITSSRLHLGQDAVEGRPRFYFRKKSGCCARLSDWGLADVALGRVFR